MKTRMARLAAAALALAVLSLALFSLHREVSHVRYRDVVLALRSLHRSHVALALALAAASYFMIGLVDRLALRYARRPQPLETSAVVGFIASAVSNTVGFSLLSGGAIRYRFYSAAGLEAADTARVVGFVGASFWVGFLAMAGLVLTLDPPAPPAAAGWHLPSLRLLGILFLAVVVAYAAAAHLLRGRVLRVRGLAVTVPPPGLVARQIAAASADWLCASGVLLVVLASLGQPPGRVLGVFIMAQIIGLISHVPGGLGVFESIFLTFLAPEVPAGELLGRLLAFRVIYYLIPFAGALLTLVGLELARRRHLIVGALATVGRWTLPLVPTVFALAAFAAGGVLLVSGATPAVGARALWAGRWLGLPVMETSHLAGSVVGVLLLLLSRGLARRLDGAYVLTLALLLAGAAFSLLKALDWEEAALLGALALALAPFHRVFYRRSSLLAEGFSARWLVAVATVLAGTTWLGFFVHRHVAYAHDLWWRFAVHGDAPRFLRATVAAVVTLVVFALARLLAGARPAEARPTPAQLQLVRQLVAQAPDSGAHLALTGDKWFLFNEARTAFLMYGHAGRSWVAMGDPIGPPEERRELAWRFHELADRHGAHTVFYEVSAENLPIYIDLGLQPQKLGEEAVVDLRGFSLAGRRWKALRGSYNKLERETPVRFEVVEAAEVPALVPALAEVSNAWLAGKHTREKGFSLGAFDPAYLASGPVALLWQGERQRLLAFANLWLGAERRELSVDLMRYQPDAPAGTMDYLFVRIMLWGQQQSYAAFNLGMAPLSGFVDRPLLPAWARVASMLYRHGDHFYNFRGLRAYKEKFHPRWRPKYLAAPGGFALPVVLANVAALVSGGLVAVFGQAGSRSPRGPGLLGAE
jgi:phosphatidylglycerol lysyltransferase